MNYLHNFLQNRTYQVETNGRLSSKKIQENGVPQGEIISVTLFLIAINEIVRQIPQTVKTCLSLTI